ncbi:hypothetical protein H6H01_17445 [Nostoc calcicola FACHB-3891]|nr:hypothetical protein [Nostoc calcicola FACHB-3891]MDZ8058807.1 hypothetical protein [Nostoc sp. EkiNYC01]
MKITAEFRIQNSDRLYPWLPDLICVLHFPGNLLCDRLNSTINVKLKHQLKCQVT